MKFEAESIREGDSSSLQFLQSRQIYEQSGISSFKTPDTQIMGQGFLSKPKKHGKIGKKRELKLMIQNISDFKHIVPRARRVQRKSMVQIESCSQSESYPIKKHKKIKNPQKIARKIKRPQNGNLHNIKNESTNFQTNASEQQIYRNTEKQNHAQCINNRQQDQYNILKGGIGHSTVIFNTPIIEGSYYLQFQIVEQMENVQYSNASDVRIGVCGAGHKYDTPLGYKNSIGLSLSRQKIVTEGRSQLLAYTSREFNNLKLKENDVIGLKLQFSPPYKNPNPEKYWQQSSLSYYVNGKQFFRYEKVKQMVYFPAVSFYNGACIQVRTRKNQMMYMPDYCLAYEQASSFTSLYHR